MTTSTYMWVPVEDSSPNTSSKFQVQVEDSCQSCDRTARKLHIIQPQLTLNCTHAKKHKLQLTQQKQEEPNSAETIDI